MSTRCQIKLKGKDLLGGVDKIYIYKHCDGYPDGVIPTLKQFVKDFISKRGFDPAYLLCQIVREFVRQDHGDIYIGWGLDCIEHSDIEYLYEVDAKTGEIYINGNVETKEDSCQ